MPTYDYHCAACGDFETLRAMAARNEDAACPECGVAAPRVLASAPHLALMEDSTRRAMDINERARHEPKRSAELARRHPSGCSCCSAGKSGKRSSTVTSASGNKAFPTKRPWMISH
ncbi:putative FmdB family regulatory protein [Actimicrobium sp. GrIS 1.19]|uniref:FmdB family zinc ribbon protein n=1 Tax=Actimicrobium sp. GrIS 1.19 TaxID=3071708 RepID=UPI002DFAB71B|nr:putative FmdB family regulatory protein [Actimicrobium sp. GrIS 1.19]